MEKKFEYNSNLENSINKESEDEIDIIEIFAKIWVKRKFILITTLIFITIGFFDAISTPNTYTASTIMVPQTGDKRSGNSISGLAAMAGINLGSISSGEVLSPTIYPQILSNVNFQKELLYSKFAIKKANEPITYFEYRTNKKYSSFSLFGTIKKYTIGLPRIIIGTITLQTKDIPTNEAAYSEIPNLSFDENRIIKALFANLILSINNKDGYISLSFTSGEPTLSAEVVQTAQKLLQKYITEFKLQKVKSNLEFVEISYNEAKKKFEEKQADLAMFRDRNITLSSAMAKTYEEKLISEYNLLLNVYTELAKQREQAKIAVTETTPILTVIKPAIIPNDNSGPRRSLILVGYIFLGLISGTGWVIVKPFLFDLKNKLNNYVKKI